MIDAKILMQAVLESRDGVTISDVNLPDNPLIFVNHAFEKMTGYSREEALNRNCRYLQGSNNKQRNLDVIRNAISNAEYCMVTLRNYRKDGSMFWNELSISPVINAEGKLTNFIGIQKDVTDRVENDQRLRREYKSLQESRAKLENLVIFDSLTGIYNRLYFETQYKDLWQYALNNQVSLTLMMLDVDYFKQYNDTYGHIAGDDALKVVASTLKSLMRRQTDFTARYGGEEFVMLATSLTRQQAIRYANSLCTKLKALNIKHENSPHGVLTISCGVAHINNVSKSSPYLLLQDADTALYYSKSNGRSQATML